MISYKPLYDTLLKKNETEYELIFVERCTIFGGSFNIDEEYELSESACDELTDPMDTEDRDTMELLFEKF